MLNNLACTKIYDPFIGLFNVHLYACCANSMGLHGSYSCDYLNIYALMFVEQLKYA